MRRFIPWILSSVAASLLLTAARAPADTVQLANGEVLRGSVILLDAKQLKFHSESLGEVGIDRAKVATIALGDAHAPVGALPPSLPAPLPAVPSVRPIGAPATGTSDQPATIEGLLKQLQSGGSAPGKALTPDDLFKQLESGKSPELEELKKNLPLFAAPEVRDYFNKQVGGLLDGSVSVNDIRNEAIRARDETRAAVKDLGPDAEAALAPYLGILERFIRETEPQSPTPPVDPKK